MKTKSKKIISTMLIVILLCSIAFAGWFFLFRKRLKYNEEFAKLAIQKVEQAQYLPDVEKLFGDNSLQISLLAAAPATPENTVENIDKAAFKKIVDIMGTFEGSRYSYYTVYDVKNEIEYVLEHVPAFGQWFKLPQMRARHGFVDIPIFDGLSYYMEYDQSSDVLSITSVRNATAHFQLNFDNRQSSYDNRCYEIMNVKYYQDNGNEVVEISQYVFGEDNDLTDKNIRNNATLQDIHPYDYIYIKNVEDVSLTKYQITTAENYRDENSFDEGGVDIRDKYPYGTTRDFVHLNYSDDDNIDMLRISQILPTDIYREAPTTNIMFYGEVEGVVDYYSTAYDYYNENTTVTHGLLKAYLETYNTDSFDISKLFSFTENLDHDTYAYWYDTSDIDAQGVVYSDNITRIEQAYALNSREDIFLNNMVNSIVNLCDTIGGNTIASTEFRSNISVVESINGDKIHAAAIDKYIDNTCKTVIDNFDLKNNVINIIKGMFSATRVDQIYGDFYGRDDVFIEDLYCKIDFNYRYNNDVNRDYYLSGDAEIIHEKFESVDKTKQYSLSTALKSENGDLYIVDRCYQQIITVPGEDDSAEDLHYLPCNKGVKPSDAQNGLYNLNIDKAGKYVLEIVLTSLDSSGQEEILLDTNVALRVFDFNEFSIPDSVNDDGTTSHYKVYNEGSKLIVEVVVE